MLAVLSAGAAKGLVEALQETLHDQTGARITGSFGAVGAIREQFASGADCDVLILTAAQLDELAGQGSVAADTIAPLGRVATGIAVRCGDPHPVIADRAELSRTFARAKALYCPDTERATAGIHFMNVLRALDLWPGAAERLRAFPSGAIAMRELAQAQGDGLVGCTQITEILYTPGVELVGPLPAPYALETIYSVAITTRARHPDLARSFAALLAGPNARELRERGGLMPL